ncbi:hypothetical protein TNCV_4997441 [Trichonephila clavipes]|nr:hypothetical protein TNCV_4997441 [Trichonephila clavipes]
MLRPRVIYGLNKEPFSSKAVFSSIIGKRSKSQKRKRVGIGTSYCSATGGLWATDHVILNPGQVTRTTPGLARSLS